MHRMFFSGDQNKWFKLWGTLHSTLWELYTTLEVQCLLLAIQQCLFWSYALVCTLCCYDQIFDYLLHILIWTSQLLEDDLRDAILLIFCNKMDLPDALPPSGVAEQLNLHNMRTRKVLSQHFSHMTIPSQSQRSISVTFNISHCRKYCVYSVFTILLLYTQCASFWVTITSHIFLNLHLPSCIIKANAKCLYKCLYKCFTSLTSK